VLDVRDGYACMTDVRAEGSAEGYCGSVGSHELYTGLYEGDDGVICAGCLRRMCMTDVRAERLRGSGSVVSHELYTGLYEGDEDVFMRCHACWLCVTDMRP